LLQASDCLLLLADEITQGRLQEHHILRGVIFDALQAGLGANGTINAVDVELFVSNGESRDHGGLVRDMPLLPLPLPLVKPLAD
jgi:hypothetical protein